MKRWGVRYLTVLLVTAAFLFNAALIGYVRHTDCDQRVDDREAFRTLIFGLVEAFEASEETGEVARAYMDREFPPLRCSGPFPNPTSEDS